MNFHCKYLGRRKTGCVRGKYLSYVLLSVDAISGCVLPYIPQHKREQLGFSSLVNKRFSVTLQTTSFAPSSS